MLILDETTQINFPNWLFIVIVLGIIFVGLGVFFLSGFNKVKNGYAAIYERLDKYVGTYKKGIHYFLPLVYKRVGLYKINETTRDVNISRREKASITYEIINVNKFHYSGHDFDGLVRYVINDSKEDKNELFKEKFLKIGIKYISYEIKRI